MVGRFYPISQYSTVSWSGSCSECGWKHSSSPLRIRPDEPFDADKEALFQHHWNGKIHCSGRTSA